MRDRIRERLTEYREEALQRIGDALYSTIVYGQPVAARGLGGMGRLNSLHASYRAINNDYEYRFAIYMDQSASFIHHVAPASWAEYAGELRDAANKLKQEIIAKIDHDNHRAGALPENAMRVRSRNELDVALNKIIKRRVEDFELEGKGMSPSTQNTVNIIGSNISNSVLQITQSGKDATWKETAQKLEQLVSSEEIKALPENDRLEVLDRVDDIVKELQAPATDKGKVHRALTRLADFISSVASKSVADIAAQLAMKALGM